MDIAVLISVIGALVALTNIITQVVKKVTWDKIPTNILSLIVSALLTICAGIAYSQIESIEITWYMIVSLVVISFMVAYAAMFGFDKLKEAMNWSEKHVK